MHHSAMGLQWFFQDLLRVLRRLFKQLRLQYDKVMIIRTLQYAMSIHRNTRTGTFQISVALLTSMGRESSVGIATRYELDGPGIESRWGRDFPHPSRPALGPTLPSIQCVPGHFRG